MEKIKDCKTCGYGTKVVKKITYFECEECGEISDSKNVKNIIFTRAWAMPSFATFTIKPIAELLERYRVGIGWIDPFAGWNSPAEFTNDINLKAPTTHHTEAEKFVQSFGLGKYYALFDPPYSNRQISEHYKDAGLSATQLDTSAQFYSKVKDRLAGVIRNRGYVISFGWNSNAMGKNRGFEIVEILLVAHGGSHNDTIVTVERKINSSLSLKGNK